jgi:hypothetical protein
LDKYLRGCLKSSKIELNYKFSSVPKQRDVKLEKMIIIRIIDLNIPLPPSKEGVCLSL